MKFSTNQLINYQGCWTIGRQAKGLALKTLVQRGDEDTKCLWMMDDTQMTKSRFIADLKIKISASVSSIYKSYVKDIFQTLKYAFFN